MRGPQKADVTGGGAAGGGGGGTGGHLCPWTPHQAQTPYPVPSPGSSLDPALWGDTVPVPFPSQSRDPYAMGGVSEARAREVQPTVAATQECPPTHLHRHVGKCPARHGTAQAHVSGPGFPWEVGQWTPRPRQEGRLDSPTARHWGLEVQRREGFPKATQFSRSRAGFGA